MSKGNSEQIGTTQSFNLTISHRSIEMLGRISATMLVVGLCLGATSLLSWFWIESAVLPQQDGTEALIVEGYTPLVFLVVAALAAPVVAGLAGVVEGQRVLSSEDALLVGVGCFIGATVLVFAAGVFIGSTGGDGGAGLGAMDLLGLAGLSGVVSAISGVSTAAVTRTIRTNHPAIPPARPAASTSGQRDSSETEDE